MDGDDPPVHAYTTVFYSLRGGRESQDEETSKRGSPRPIAD